MRCTNCGDEAKYTYNGNTLCRWCFDLARLLEAKTKILSKLSEPPKKKYTVLLKETQTKIDECKYWISISREGNSFYYPLIIKEK